MQQRLYLYKLPRQKNEIVDVDTAFSPILMPACYVCRVLVLFGIEFIDGPSGVPSTSK